MSPVKQYAWDGVKWRGYGSALDITAGDAPAPGVLPTGPGYTPYADLKALAVAKFGANPTLQQVFNQQTTATIVTMPAGVYETVAPWGKAPYEVGASAPPTDYAFRPLKICRGIWGEGRGTLGSDVGATVIKVTPNTCVSASEGGSWFQGGGDNSGPFTMKNVQVRGTDQGLQTMDYAGSGIDGVSPKLFTNLFFNNFSGPLLMEDILSTGWYANNGAPPGETFGIEIYYCHHHVLRRVEVDGRRAVGGLSYGGAGMTAGNCLGATWYNCKSTHMNAKTAGMVFFQSINCKTYDCEIGDSTDGDGNGQFGLNGGGFNHERAAGSEHYRLKIYKNVHASPGFSGTPDKGTHVNHCGDDWVSSKAFEGVRYGTANGTMKLYDCTWNNMWGYTISAANSPTGVAYPNPLFVASWDPYGGVPNAMTISPEVWQGGVAQPMHWLPGGVAKNVIGPYQL